MNLINNERVKLTATYLNGMAIAVFAVGGFAPFIATLTGAGRSGTAIVFGLSLVCIGTSVALHLAARRYLKGLRE